MTRTLKDRLVQHKRMRGRKWAVYSVAGEGAWLVVWGMHYTEEADGIQDRGDEWVDLLQARGESVMNTTRCDTCHKHINVCPNGGDCGEVRAIYREQQREKCRDLDPDEIECDVCGYTYAERSHDFCHWGEYL